MKDSILCRRSPLTTFKPKIDISQHQVLSGVAPYFGTGGGFGSGSTGDKSTGVSDYLANAARLAVN